LIKVLVGKDSFFLVERMWFNVFYCTGKVNKKDKPALVTERAFVLYAC